MRFGKKKKFGSSPRKASKPTGPDPFIGSAAHPSASEEDDLVTQNLEEIKSMREEINWRVKNAYTGSIIFISGVSLIVGSLFTEDNKFLERIANDPEAMTLSGIAIMLAISAWAGVQNANHLIEKKIELYTLELMKVVYEKKKQVYFSWLGYLYGNSFFVHPGKQAIGKFLNASIGMFIYLLPNVIALFVFFPTVKCLLPSPIDYTRIVQF